MPEEAKSRIGERLDRLPICAFHRRILVLIGAGLCIDSFDLYMQGPVLADLVSKRWSDDAGNALFISLTFTGLTIGALLSGWAGDRWGRRTVYQINLLLFGLPTLAAAFSPNFAFLLGCRFISGIGLGGEVFTSYGALVEFVPAQQRGRWQGMLGFVSTLGLPASAFVSLVIIPNHGWRWMFFIAGILSLVVWSARKRMPESPRWYEKMQLYAQAESTMKKIESEVEKATGRVLPTLPACDLTENEAARQENSTKVLFSGRMLRRTLLAIAIMVCMNVIIYAFTAWLPTILLRSGISMAQTLLLTALIQLGSLPGTLVGAWVIDGMGRKASLTRFSWLGAILSVAFAFVNHPVTVVAVGFGLVLVTYALVIMTFATYVPEIFPTSVRLTGSGISNASGRIANIVMPHVIALCLKPLGPSFIYFLISIVFALQACAVHLFGEETSRRSLEEIDSMAERVAK